MGIMVNKWIDSGGLPAPHGPNPFPQHPVNDLPVGRTHSTEALGIRVGSGSSIGSNRGVPLNVHGMTSSAMSVE